MADERVEIEIVLDDGSVQKGFLNVEKQAKRSADKSESFFKGSFTRLAGIAAGVGASLVAALGAREAISAAAEQEQAIQNLNTALSNAGTFSEEASKSIQDFATNLQRTTQFGDEVILQQVALARNFARTNEEAVNLVDAAVDLSAATGLTLDSAVRNLGKTFSGLTGELGESLPAIRTLTAEQLKNGEAVKLISDLFGGTAAKNVQTFTGRVQQLSNNFSDALEGLGQFITRLPITSKLFEIISNSLADAAEFLKSFTNNTDGIVALNNGLVDFGQNVIKFVVAPLELAFNLGVAFVNSFRAGLSFLTIGLVSFGQILVEATLRPFDFILENLSRVARLIPGVGESVAGSLDSARQTISEFGQSTNQVLEDVGTFAAGEFDKTSTAAVDSFKNILNFDFSANSSDFIEGLRVTNDQINEELGRATDQIANTVGTNLEKTKEVAKKISLDIGQSLSSGISRGVQGFVSALAAGQNAFEALGKSILGLLGDLAIQVGTFLITTGIGQQALTATPGGPVIAAGIGLVALGTVLKTIGGSGFAPGGAATGGAGTGASDQFTDTAGQDIGEGDFEEKTTQVNIDVSGQVLNPVEVGSQLADIINESFRSGGTRVETA